MNRPYRFKQMYGACACSNAFIEVAVEPTEGRD